MNKKRMTWLIHVLTWVVLFGFPLLSLRNWSGEEGLQNVFIARMLIIPLTFLLVFYINYVLLIDKYLFSKKLSQFFLLNALIIVLSSGFTQVWMNRFFPLPMPGPDDRIIIHFLRDLFSLMLATGLAVALKVTINWYQVDDERKELERINTQTELKNLKSQLNPHFLFNTLNNIYSLISISPEEAQNAIHQLSKLLRYVLYEDNQTTVPLSKDLDFISNYVDLMRIRLPETAQLDMDIDSARTSSVQIAPLLFISLIENAFKHGISNTKPSSIQIKIDYLEDKKQVACVIRNTNYPKDAHDESGSGVGLLNLRKRLELLYPTRHSLKCEHNGDYYTATLLIDVNDIP